MLKLEGLDPDFEPGSGEGAPNDGRLRYTVGANYFFTREGERAGSTTRCCSPSPSCRARTIWCTDFDALWRMSF